MDIQALGMLSNITAIVQKQNVNTIENDINVEINFRNTVLHRKYQIIDVVCIYVCEYIIYKHITATAIIYLIF